MALSPKMLAVLRKVDAARAEFFADLRASTKRDAEQVRAQDGGLLADGGALRSVLFQPYIGWIINNGDFYAHGFQALVVPIR